MTIETGLIIWGMVVYGIIYSLKRLFNIWEYKIKGEEEMLKFPTEFVNKDIKDSCIFMSKDDNKDLDKTLELSPIWK